MTGTIQEKTADTRPKTSARRRSISDTAAPKPRKADITRMALVEAAERLIARKGFGNVTTREILSEAGQKNQSALQYHFGSKDGLFGATINERTRQIDKWRLEMLDDMGDDLTLRQVYEALIYPLRELIKNDAAGKNYLSFLAQAVTRPEWELRKIIQDHDIKGMVRCYEEFDRILADLSAEERFVRQNAAFDSTIITLKRWCMTKSKKKQSLEQVIEFVIRCSCAIVTMESLSHR